MEKAEYGLLSAKGGAIPLVGVSVEGGIAGRGAKVRVSQRFRNGEKKPVEAVYKFPLPEGSAICGFQARIDGKTIRGQVEEREKAFQDYDEALSEGKGGYLLDEERPNIFTLSVGNLNPGAEVVVEIDYVTLLDTEGSKVRFFLPTTISPRYVPDHMPDRDGIPENEKVNPSYAADVPYGFSLSLKVHGVDASYSVESPSHPVKVAFSDGQIDVGLSCESARMDRDFILYVDNKKAASNHAYVCQWNGEEFVQLDLCLGSDSGGPKAGREVQDEIIFLLDCSGSMEGDSIAEAKKVLAICLRGLDQGTRFNICRFGSTFGLLFPESQVYSEKTLNAALKRLEDVDADLGGTEVLGPLQHLYATPPPEGSKRIIVLLTDGEVGNEGEVIDLVRSNQASTAFFSLGIGAGPNEYLIKGLARAGRGGSEFIYPGERIEPKVLQIFGKLRKGRIDDLSIDWGAAVVEQAPQAPAVFEQSPVTVFAKFKGPRAVGAKVVVTAGLAGETRSWEVDVVRLEPDDISLPVLWARERIRDLEECGVEGGGSRQANRKLAKSNDALLALSKRYGVLSGLTSYIAVEERTEEQKTKERAELRKVPVLITQGWHGLGGVPIAGQACGIASLPSVVSHERRSHSLFLAIQSADGSVLRKAPGLPVAKSCRVAKDRTDLLLAILSLQRPEGGFELNTKTAKLLGIDLKHLKKSAAALQPDTAVDAFTVLSTAVVLVALRERFAAERATWAGVVEKSEDWFNAVVSTEHPKIEGQDLLDWASDLLS